MMRIFYIDWQQHWECHRTVNIGDQLHQADYKVEEVFFNLDLVVEHSAPMYLLFAPYTDF